MLVRRQLKKEPVNITKYDVVKEAFVHKRTCQCHYDDLIKEAFVKKEPTNIK